MLFRLSRRSSPPLRTPYPQSHNQSGHSSGRSGRRNRGAPRFVRLQTYRDECVRFEGRRGLRLYANAIKKNCRRETGSRKVGRKTDCAHGKWILGLSPSTQYNAACPQTNAAPCEWAVLDRVSKCRFDARHVTISCGSGCRVSANTSRVERFSPIRLGEGSYPRPG